MNVFKVTPSSYCYGVTDAISIAKSASLDKNLPRPIHILGMVIHNKHIKEAFMKQGIYSLSGNDRLSMLDQIDTGTVIFTAHGVSPAVKQKALNKGLICIDTTCPDVQIIHELILHHLNQGYEILYLGIKNHPETEGVLDIDSERVHLLENLDQLTKLTSKLMNKPIFVANETTLSQWDVAELVKNIKEIYPNAKFQSKVCSATQDRQSAIVKQASKVDVVIVVGDVKSNNTSKLAQVAKTEQNQVHKIENVKELNPEWFVENQIIAVTAGASTPPQVVNEVVQCLKKYQVGQMDTWDNHTKINPNDLLNLPITDTLFSKRSKKMGELRTANQL